MYCTLDPLRGRAIPSRHLRLVMCAEIAYIVDSTIEMKQDLAQYYVEGRRNIPSVTGGYRSGPMI
jgi:hypothetical protein